MIRLIHSTDNEFRNVLDSIMARGETAEAHVEATVRSIIDDVRVRGDEALVEYTEKFDRVKIFPAQMRVSRDEIIAARSALKESQVHALQLAADRIRAFHQRQVENSWFMTEDTGTILGQMVRPVERAGIYVPGGKASYPSSVLMNAIPARVAGVKKVIMVVPTPNGEINPALLVAANIAGVDEIYKIGGAQAVAALAYGTATVPKVDVIVGPGNIYVATAKRMVFGTVNIDMIAGPSEILVIADDTAHPRYIAADLLSQAEHDELASSILVTTSEELAHKVKDELGKQLSTLSRRTIASKALLSHGALIVVKDLTEAVSVANRIAPEHLELSVAAPFELLPQIENAGAIFLGHYTAEAVGDYAAGPNHVLPTGGTVRFSSPLSVHHFVKRSSVIAFSKKGLHAIGDDVMRIADMEGLEAHGLAVKVRMQEG